MDPAQAREIMLAEDAHARSVVNLGNAVAMTADEPGAQKLLEDAGDAYAHSALRLATVREKAVNPLVEVTLAPVADLHADDPSAQQGGKRAEGAEEEAAPSQPVQPQEGTPPPAAAPVPVEGDSGPQTVAQPVGDTPPAS